MNERIAGVVTAVVADLDDPEGEGRIQVQYRWLPGEPLSPWAPVAVALAGDGRGSYFMPEPGDEVLVAFEQGDFNHPFVVGFLWNGAHRPPSGDINTSVRRLRTVSGHVLEFDDNDGQERILLKTQSGHEVELKDSAPASILLKTQGGHEVALKDSVPASILIKTQGGQEISLTDAPGGITISAQTGTVTMNCLQAEVNATALLTVNAPITRFMGVVQALSIIGSAYTPGPGNTYGL